MPLQWEILIPLTKEGNVRYHYSLQNFDFRSTTWVWNHVFQVVRPRNDQASIETSMHVMITAFYWGLPKSFCDALGLDIYSKVSLFKPIKKYKLRVGQWPWFVATHRPISWCSIDGNNVPVTVDSTPTRDRIHHPLVELYDWSHTHTSTQHVCPCSAFKEFLGYNSVSKSALR